jgi:hypothetical protein
MSAKRFTDNYILDNGREMDESGGRQAGDEASLASGRGDAFNVTPEMIEAGAEVLRVEDFYSERADTRPSKLRGPSSSLWFPVGIPARNTKCMGDSSDLNGEIVKLLSEFPHFFRLHWRRLGQAN